MSYENMGWIRKRFLEFRTGHAIYLAFAVSLATFVIIAHRLLIERIPFLSQTFGDLTTFTILFVIVYIPIAVLMGQWHYKYQYKVESTVQFMQNPGMLKAFRLILELQTDTADKNDVDAFKKLLKNLEKKSMVKDLRNNSSSTNEKEGV